MKKLTKVNLILVGCLVLLIFLFGLWTGDFRPNPALSKFKTIDQQVVAKGGQLLCSEGHKPSGLDNPEPWYVAYYTIPDSTNLTQQIKEILTGQGYKVDIDNERISNLQTGKDIGYPNVETYSTNNEYLRSTQYGNHLDKLYLEIIRDSKVALDCNGFNGVTYGETKSPATGNAILYFSLSLPSTH